MNKEIEDLELINFSNLHSSFDKYINTLRKHKIYKSNIVDIMELNNKLHELEIFLEKIKMNILTKNSLQLDDSSYESLKEYDKDAKTIKTFIPFLMMYRMNLDQLN